MTIIPLNEEKAKKFLYKNSLTNCEIKKIAGDASFRSYYRIFCAEKISILMFAPPSHEEIQPFIDIDKFLFEHGFCAPEIFAIDEENGFLLLEDFGDETYGRILQKNVTNEEELYKKAIDCLVELQKISPPKNVAIYNHDLLFKEVMLFVDWYLIYEKKIDLNLARRQEFKRLWFDLFDLLNREDQTLVLRDFHADNLMLLKNNNVGLLDFQDAVIGSKAYDLVSLLEDARRDLAPNLASKMLQYFLQNSSIDQEKFLHDYEILSLQRNIKILGIFSRLARRDGKEFYLKLLPRVRDYVITRISTDSEVLQKISQFLKDYV